MSKLIDCWESSSKWSIYVTLLLPGLKDRCERGSKAVSEPEVVGETKRWCFRIRRARHTYEFPVVVTARTRPGWAQTRKCLSKKTGSSLEVLPLAKKLLASKWLLEERRSVFFRSVTTGRSTRSQRKAKNRWAARTILGRLKTKGGLDLGGEGREWV